MTAINTLLSRVTHPQRKPMVRDCTFVDGIGPPPWTFFDETQDHLGAYFGAALGWSYSFDSDDFEKSGPSNAGYIGKLTVYSGDGVLSYGPSNATYPGEHGVWDVRSNNLNFSILARSALVTLDGDFLMTAKVMPLGLDTLDDVSQRGLFVAAGLHTSSPAIPGFSAGGDSTTWRAFGALTNSTPGQFFDTGIPVESGRWYRLQISRVAGAVRWFINGALVRPSINGKTEEGIYYPYRLLSGCKVIECSRSGSGAVDSGFRIDAFHLLAERSVA